MQQSRSEQNDMMSEQDQFFKNFSDLDQTVYSNGAIPKKYKELTGLTISILTRCDDCVVYHIENCITEGASKDELIEAIKMGVIGGGSITYPTARLAFSIMKDVKN